MCVHVHVPVAYSCRWLAYTLVCVNVALTVRAGVCHILQVINQTGNQAAAEITPENEEQTKYYVAVSNTCTWLYMVKCPEKKCSNGRKKIFLSELADIWSPHSSCDKSSLSYIVMAGVFPARQHLLVYQVSKSFASYWNRGRRRLCVQNMQVHNRRETR